jgi:hypothetical protein
MKENWGPHFMPPRYYEVLDKRVFPSLTDPNRRTEWVWLSGTYPNLGIPVNGWTGSETFVERTVGSGETVVYRMRFDNLTPNHPLYERMKLRKHG